MPIYEYVCNKCQKPFEALVRGGETPECPFCGSKQLSKQLSIPSTHSHGEGSGSTGGSYRPVPS